MIARYCPWRRSPGARSCRNARHSPACGRRLRGLAWRPRPFLRTVTVISSSAAAVSSRLAACCSVRRDRSSAALEISPAPDCMLRVLSAITDKASCICDTALVEVLAQNLVGVRQDVVQHVGQVAGRHALQPGADGIDDKGLLGGDGIGLGLAPVLVRLALPLQRIGAELDLGDGVVAECEHRLRQAADAIRVVGELDRALQVTRGETLHADDGGDVGIGDHLAQRGAECNGGQNQHGGGGGQADLSAADRLR